MEGDLLGPAAGQWSQHSFHIHTLLLALPVHQGRDCSFLVCVGCTSQKDKCKESQSAQAVQSEDSWGLKKSVTNTTKATTHFNSSQEQQYCFVRPKTQPPPFTTRSEIILAWNQQETVILLAIFKTRHFLSTGLGSSYWSPKIQENLFFIKALGHIPYICVHGTLLIVACGTDTQKKSSV